jgi:D-glycero-alpha-D-manno-heptose-7-phosphate kinase
MISPKTIITKTPLRISFFGGGSDIKKFNLKKKGLIISSTIDKYIYVTIKRHGNTFDEKYRINYQQSENVSKRNKIKNNIIRESLKYLKIDEPLYISTIADIPARSGLGSSSSFTVGLLKGLFELKNKKISKKKLAELACKIEIDVIKSPIGKQDQYAAVFGGLNKFIFSKNSVSIESLEKKIDPKFFFKNLQLFFTGIYRSTNTILSSINNSSENKIYMNTIVRNAEDAYKVLKINKKNKLNIIGDLFDKSWNLKKSLSKKISNKRINTYYNKAISAGALGGKISGAGGGGFLLFITPKNRRKKVIESLNSLTYLPIMYEPNGSRVIFRD